MVLDLGDRGPVPAPLTCSDPGQRSAAAVRRSGRCPATRMWRHRAAKEPPRHRRGKPTDSSPPRRGRRDASAIMATSRRRPGVRLTRAVMATFSIWRRASELRSSSTVYVGLGPDDTGQTRLQRPDLSPRSPRSPGSSRVGGFNGRVSTQFVASVRPSEHSRSSPHRPAAWRRRRSRMTPCRSLRQGAGEWRGFRKC